MMLGPVLLLAMVAAQAPPPSPPRAAWEDWIGGLRHVQLLDVTDEATTFATALAQRRGPGGVLALYRVPRESTLSDSRGVLGAPFAHVAFEESILPIPTWEDAPPWRVVQSTDGWVVVALEVRRGRLALVRLRDGARTEVAESAQAFLDARVDGCAVQVLARSDGHIVLYEIEGGKVRLWNLLADNALGTAAAFVAGVRNEVAIARWIEGALHVTHVDLAGAPVLDVALDDVQRDDAGEAGLRVRAWSDGKRRLDVVGDASYRNRVGRVVTARSADKEPGTTLRVVPPNLPGTLPRLGHAIELVRDTDGDELPDVVIGAPGTMTGFAFLLGSRTDARQAPVPTNDDWLAWGSSVSATSDGRFVLVAGGTPTHPESHRNPSAAALIEIVPGVGSHGALRQLWRFGNPTFAHGR